MEVFNGNRTFEFIPDSDEYAGKLYFFKIILKEEGSNALGNQFTFQVFIDSLESEDEDETTDGGQNGGGNDSNTTPDTDQEAIDGDGNTDG